MQTGSARFPQEAKEKEQLLLRRREIEHKRLKMEATIAELQAAFKAEKAEEHRKGNNHIEIVDIVENPVAGRSDQILAIPTVVRRLPPPLVKIIGDLSNTERVLVGLSITPN
ncbi:MAG: circadian clock KaiB family protein [Negativicutes bacterium]|nr:circadian clock KaiB family protein [Negativicutes bacterium]MDR3592843.1 circadian clock KaiB family protein [Negativicutes bacterium]